MNKKIISVLVAVLTVIPSYSAKAGIFKPGLKNLETNYNVAILDTAINSNMPEFAGKIIYEVCILEWNSCPNKTSFQEGPGSAGLPQQIITRNGFDHGTKMVSAFLQSNQTSGIVFIRVIGNTPLGDRQVANEKTVTQALDWILNNKDKFNIGAVSMSQGHHNLTNLSDYCPSTPETKKRITSLLSFGIPFFAASGNDYDAKRIDWPSCITETVSVGALNKRDEINLYSNSDPARLDFYAIGDMRLINAARVYVNTAGTSAATQYAVGQWLLAKTKQPSLSYEELFSLLKSKATSVIGPKGLFGLKINAGAI